MMAEPGLIVEDVADPDDLKQLHIHDRLHRRNSDWLQAHWPDIAPKARGKFVAVANQEAFIAETPREAWAWVDGAHPEDTGVIFRYVRASIGLRLYVDRR